MILGADDRYYFETGEIRPPKKGEFCVTDGRVWQSPCPLDDPVQICRPEVQVNDLLVKAGVTGGFTFVDLRDTDDGDKIVLGEEEIIILHQLLSKVVKTI